MTKVPESGRKSSELCAFRGKRGHEGVRTAPPPGRVISVISSLMLTVVSHAHTCTHTLHGSTVNIAILFLYTHPRTLAQRQDSGCPSSVLHASPSWEAVARHLKTTICSLYSTERWRELQGPGEATAPHSCSDFSPGHRGSGEKAPLRTFQIPVTPRCSSFFAPPYLTAELAADAHFICKQCLKYPVREFDHYINSGSFS